MTSEELLPVPPKPLVSGEVILRLEGIMPGGEFCGFIPYYHFRITLADGTDVGHINFRVGSNDLINLFIGHIGYEIHEEHRGKNYALQACRALAPVVRNHYSEVIVTCNTDNVASQRTIERLGATYLDEVPIPVEEAEEPRFKRRYRWNP